jgi:hypothetical protein
MHNTVKFKVKYVNVRLFARRIFRTVGSWLRRSGTQRRWCVAVLLSRTALNWGAWRKRLRRKGRPKVSLMSKDLRVFTHR